MLNPQLPACNFTDNIGFRFKADIKLRKLIFIGRYAGQFVVVIAWHQSYPDAAPGFTKLLEQLRGSPRDPLNLRVVRDFGQFPQTEFVTDDDQFCCELTVRYTAQKRDQFRFKVALIEISV